MDELCARAGADPVAFRLRHLRDDRIIGVLRAAAKAALVEEVTWDERRVTSVDWSSYPSLHLDYDVPAIETVFVTPAGVLASGAGETSITLVPAAIGNAVFDATGARLRDVPFKPARVLAALRAAGGHRLTAS
jgi:CO/xanthine dehydrogenase Mo-binding subunit